MAAAGSAFQAPWACQLAELRHAYRCSPCMRRTCAAHIARRDSPEFNRVSAAAPLGRRGIRQRMGIHCNTGHGSTQFVRGVLHEGPFAGDELEQACQLKVERLGQQRQFGMLSPHLYR